MKKKLAVLLAAALTLGMTACGASKGAGDLPKGTGGAGPPVQLEEKSFKEYMRNCRLKKIKSTNYQGQQFLNEIQEHMKQIYRSTKMGELLPNGYPIIV
jgi:outer membrane lipopolysaccharide assembly protein LptE/RlpB